MAVRYSTSPACLAGWFGPSHTILIHIHIHANAYIDIRTRPGSPHMSMQRSLQLSAMVEKTSDAKWIPDRLDLLCHS